MNQALLGQVRAKAQQGIANRMFAQADESDEQLRRLGSEVAGQCGCKAVFGPRKERARAAEKVRDDYGGDWYELKDAVRMTIVAPDATRLRRVGAHVRSYCAPHRGLGLIKDFELFPEASPCGYSGLNFVARLPNGRPGEIQANTAELMYAKMKESSFRSNLGDEEYWRIRGRYGLAGGLGHALYEVYRVAPASDRGRRAAALSRLYYGYFRGNPGLRARQALERELDAFRKANPAAFPAH